MTVRLDATEKVVIRCTEHVRDFQLVDPAVTQPLATSQQRVETLRSATEHMADHAGAAYSMHETTTARNTSCSDVSSNPCARSTRIVYIMRLHDDSSVATWSAAVSRHDDAENAQTCHALDVLVSR